MILRYQIYLINSGRQAALLLTLARLGADRGTLLAALLDGEDPHDDARQVGKIHH